MKAERKSSARCLKVPRHFLTVIRTVYVENYDMNWGRLITSGVDIWLNTPMRPQEASGTSGMKAALNGVPSFSVIDGWWAEGWIEGITGWAIGNTDIIEDPASEVATLYDKLERQILPMFYGTPNRYTEVMRSAIALNGSFFNTQRMVQQYLANAYMLREVAPQVPRAKQAVPAWPTNKHRDVPSAKTIRQVRKEFLALEGPYVALAAIKPFANACNFAASSRAQPTPARPVS